MKEGHACLLLLLPLAGATVQSLFICQHATRSHACCFSHADHDINEAVLPRIASTCPSIWIRGSANGCWEVIVVTHSTGTKFGRHVHPTGLFVSWVSHAQQPVSPQQSKACLSFQATQLPSAAPGVVCLPAALPAHTIYSSLSTTHSQPRGKKCPAFSCL